VQPGDADRVKVRFVVSSYVNVVVYVVAFVTASFFFPWYQNLILGALALTGVGRTVFRQATSITFEPTGVEVDLLFRKQHIRAPVAEFSGSRFRPVKVQDLHTAKTYDLTQYFGTRKLMKAAERHGYAVVPRPKVVYR
jgi:hypothetical protein